MITLSALRRQPIITTLLGNEPVRAPQVSAAAVTDLPDAEYVRLSQRLGVNQIPLQVVELTKVVHEMALGIYDYRSVVNYLDAQEQHINSDRTAWRRYEWNWHPIRSAREFGRSRPERVSMDLYNKPIPYPVLLTIERIESRFPKACFYVSDLRGVSDPFLAVTVEGADTLLVIERWDEPAFRSV